MVNLTTGIRESLAGAKTAFFATSSINGIPNVVPIGAFKVYDDGTILVSDQFFNKTLANMKENPHAALSWWGDRGGYQIRGTVTLHTDDEVFRHDVAWMKELRPQLKPKTAVLLKVTDVYDVKPGPDAGKKIL